MPGLPGVPCFGSLLGPSGYASEGYAYVVPLDDGLAWAGYAAVASALPGESSAVLVDVLCSSECS